MASATQMGAMPADARSAMPGDDPDRPSPPQGEEGRLAALRRYRILDTPEEAPFNHLAMLACDLLRTEIALVSFVDETRQWFKARIGVGAQQTSRDCSFCAHAITGDLEQVFVVPDTRVDGRFATNPLVTGEPWIRFYAGAPIRTPDGFPLGTVCVVSGTPRPDGITVPEQRWLTALAALAMDELELRLRARQAQEAAAAEARLRAGAGGDRGRRLRGQRGRRPRPGAAARAPAPARAGRRRAAGAEGDASRRACGGAPAAGGHGAAARGRGRRTA